MAMSSCSEAAHSQMVETACSLLEPSTSGMADRLEAVTVRQSQDHMGGDSPTCLHLLQAQRRTFTVLVSPIFLKHCLKIFVTF